MLGEDSALLPIGSKLLAWFLSRKTKVLQTQKGYQRICIPLNWLHTGLQLIRDGAASAEIRAKPVRAIAVVAPNVLL